MMVVVWAGRLVIWSMMWTVVHMLAGTQAFWRAVSVVVLQAGVIFAIALVADRRLVATGTPTDLRIADLTGGDRFMRRCV